jgi:hypothetical protein
MCGLTMSNEVKKKMRKGAGTGNFSFDDAIVQRTATE